MTLENIYELEEFKDQPIRRTDEGLYEIVTLAPRDEIGKQLFGNTLGFNEIRIVVKDEVPVFWSAEGPKISHVLPQGLVVSCDTATIGDNPLDKDGDNGFHNYLIPWSQIVYVSQYIAT